MSVDVFSDAMIIIKNSEFVAKRSCSITPASKLILATCSLLRDLNYIEGFDVKENPRGGILEVKLKGAITECKAIKPRYSVQVSDYERFEKRYLPSKNIGYLVVSTPKGIMAHREAKKQGIGGKLMAYVY
ncbi:MAG: 30S ribosomal protein S8 [Candidatus Diapherotrites archaeon CG09_land_8_20_14_0_10_32_12]|nr:MAG: 30S ribosomal protein S8 [Candidatus Diapherotrites archaeon CG09_land_8_20_14_0_10_32_12]